MTVGFFTNQGGQESEVAFDSYAQLERVMAILATKNMANPGFASGGFTFGGIDGEHRRSPGAWLPGTTELVISLIDADREQYPNG